MIAISVTQEDIDEGVCMDANNCAVQRAICRTLHLLPHQVSVDGMFITINGKDYLTPDAINDWIQIYDDGGIVEPIAFQIWEN